MLIEQIEHFLFQIGLTSVAISPEGTITGNRFKKIVAYLGNFVLMYCAHTGDKLY